MNAMTQSNKIGQIQVTGAVVVQFDGHRRRSSRWKPTTTACAGARSRPASGRVHGTPLRWTQLAVWFVAARSPTRLGDFAGRHALRTIINVIGEPVDEAGPVQFTQKRAIHQDAPAPSSQLKRKFSSGIRSSTCWRPMREAAKVSVRRRRCRKKVTI
jgi:hypothetical protein